MSESHIDTHSHLCTYTLMMLKSILVLHLPEFLFTSSTQHSIWHIATCLSWNSEQIAPTPLLCLQHHSWHCEKVFLKLIRKLSWKLLVYVYGGLCVLCNKSSLYGQNSFQVHHPIRLLSAGSITTHYCITGHDCITPTIMFNFLMEL